MSLSAGELERFVEEKAVIAQAELKRGVKEAADYARREPEKALLFAFAAGYVLRMMPGTRLLDGLLRLALSLLKPAFLIYVLTQLWQRTQASPPPRGAQE